MRPRSQPPAATVPGALVDAGLDALRWLAARPVSLGGIAATIAMAATAAWGAAALALGRSD